MNERKVNHERWSFADVQIRGRAGQDGMLKYTASGKPILTFSVAINRGSKEARRTIWLNVKAFGDLAEGAQVRKGDLLDVTGNLDVSSWNDKTTGALKERTEVLASTIQVYREGHQAMVPGDIYATDEDIPF